MKNLLPPSINFNAVRDKRSAQVYYYDVDLNTARSAAAGTALALPISGNSFFINANPSDGFGFVHFQDTNFDAAPAPIYVSPGAIFKIPFTQILFENVAQVGKKIRFIYGTDIDFLPGSVAQQAISGSISTIEAVYGKSPLSLAWDCSVGISAIAAAPGVGVLWNPPGSGKYYYVDTVTIVNGGVASNFNVSSVSNLGNLTLSGNSVNKYLSAAQGGAQGYFNNAVASTATIVSNYDYVALGANSQAVLKYNSPFVLPPGWGIGVNGNTNNTQLNAYFQYTEN